MKVKYSSIGTKDKTMNDENISRRVFIRDASLTTAGAVAAAITLNSCSAPKGRRAIDAAKIKNYSPKKDGGCAVSFGYDCDMPYGGNAYLYDKMLPWQRKDGKDAHGHLNQDVRDYIERLVTIAENYGARHQFFIQGNTFEKQVDVEFWKKIAERGHAIDSHMYNHDSMLGVSPEEVKFQLTRTKHLIETELGTENIGLRGPGGYGSGLNGREDIQRAVLDAGIKWVSTQYIHALKKNDSQRSAGVVSEQGYYYKTGLLEIPFCGHQDRTYFDSDCDGDPTKTPDDWIGYLKKCVDVAYANNLFLALTVHPSTSFKHDPEARYVKEIFEYCRQKPGTLLCTYQDIYRWLTNDQTGIS